MKFGSVCSGIEAASVASAPLGWEAAWLAEIETFPSAVLKHHYPNVPNLRDMTKLEEHDVYRRTSLDLLCGGTPCQSFSVAGLRGGIKDARGNLCLTFCEIAHAKRPRFVLWENVPGVLSSGGGADFGCFLAGLSGADAALRPPLGGWNGAGIVAGPVYGLAWRVLDAQYFGVPQRRQRVFVVGCLGDWRTAAKILFEPQGMPRDSQAGRQAGEDAAAVPGEVTAGNGEQGIKQIGSGINESLARAVGTREGARHKADQETYVIQERAVSENIETGLGGKGWQEGKAYTLEARHHVQAVAHTLPGEGHDASEDGTGRGESLVPSLLTMREGKDGGGKGPLVARDKSLSLATGNNQVLFQPCDLTNGRLTDQNKSLCIDASQDKGNRGQGVIVPTVTYMRGNGDGKICPTLTKEASGDRPSDYAPMVFQQNSCSEVRKVGGDGEVAGTVTGEPGVQCQNYLAFTQGNLARGEGPRPSPSVFPTFQKEAGDQHPCVKTPTMAVRRLTPREFERLQGFTDDYTKVPVFIVRHRKKCPTMQPRVEPCYADPEQEEMARAEEKLLLAEMRVEVVFPTDAKTAPCGCKIKKVPAEDCPDGPRYKAIGNSWAVPCVRWIFERMDKMRSKS